MKRQYRGKDPLPALLVTRIKDGHDEVYVWCPFCRLEHLHGNQGGHRTAHCGDGSPFEETGYLIVVSASMLRSMSPKDRTLWRGYVVSET